MNMAIDMSAFGNRMILGVDVVLGPTDTQLLIYNNTVANRCKGG